MVTTERHLPSGERHEYHPIPFDQTTYLAQKVLLVENVLNHVVAHHHVENSLPCRTVWRGAFLHLEEVLADEKTLQPLSGKTILGSDNIVRCQIDTRHLASACSNGGKIAAYAATHLQYTQPRHKLPMLLDIGNKELLTRSRQLVEILLSCNTSYRHCLFLRQRYAEKPSIYFFKDKKNNYWPNLIAFLTKLTNTAPNPKQYRPARCCDVRAIFWGNQFYLIIFSPFWMKTPRVLAASTRRP